MKCINVIGLGYIGLPTALILAASGHKVIGTDYNSELISTLQRGRTTFKEKGLDELFAEADKKGISFTDQYIQTDLYIISVPTPYEKENKKIDPAFIINAVREVLLVASKGAVIVIESTVSPGTIDKHIRPLIQSLGYVIGEDIHLVHAPERILPGNMLYELRHNSRTIGADDLEIGNYVKSIYSSFCKAEITITDIRTAEMTKVIENTYRDINIAFANELAQICRSDHMDVYKIIEIANKHPRVNILNPGPGVGGHCISVDPWFLVGDYPGLSNIIGMARKINDSMPEYVLKRISSIMDKTGISDIKKIGLYGLTYKENVDDIRESPTLQLLDSMKNHLAHGIKVYDPYIKENIVENQFYNLTAFLDEVEIVVIMVNHQEIINNSHMLDGKTVLDTRHVLKGEHIYYL